MGGFADFVHGLSLLSLLLHKMCSIEQTRDDLLDKNVHWCRGCRTSRHCSLPGSLRVVLSGSQTATHDRVLRKTRYLLRVPRTDQFCILPKT
jgi:hypothetical protein